MSPDAQINQSIIINKRAQSLYMSREEESQYDGLIKKNASDYVTSIIQFQASLVESKSAAGLAGGYVIGAGKTPSGSLIPRGMAMNRKQSILRRTNTHYQYGYSSGGMSAYGSGVGGVPGGSSMFADPNDQQQVPMSDDLVIQGNALLVAHNSSTEFKLKYAMINH